jgi:general L-amino acid transport system substrate-binding protein
MLTPAFVAAVVLAAPAAAGTPEDALAAVQDRGYVRCGMHRSGVGLAEIRTDGAWAGYFVELCRAIALAAIGDSDAIRVQEVDDLSAALALEAREVDVVLSSIRPVDAAVDPGIVFLSPLIEDQQMLVSFLDGVGGVDDLPPMARICASGHPTMQANLRRALAGRADSVRVMTYASVDGVFNAFFSRRCDALSHHHYAILAQSLLRSPQRTPMWRSQVVLGPVAFVPSVRGDDAGWIAVVDAAVRAALHRPGPVPEPIPESVGDGLAARVQTIANSRTAIFDRTLGHMGGQGFPPPPDLPLPSGS